MSDYEVGRLYKATVRGEKDMLARWSDGYWWTPEVISDRATHAVADVTDIRPITLLDLTDVDGTQFDPARLAGLLTAAQAAAQTAKDARMVRSLRDQIIEQTKPSKPPKPPEPKGLGAVVLDRHGDAWVRVSAKHARPWANGDGCWHCYADISAEAVLSEGIET